MTTQLLDERSALCSLHAGKRRRSDGADGNGKAKERRRGKCYQPGYRTANFALLVCLHRAELQGKPSVDKPSLIKVRRLSTPPYLSGFESHRDRAGRTLVAFRGPPT